LPIVRSLKGLIYGLITKTFYKIILETLFSKRRYVFRGENYFKQQVDIAKVYEDRLDYFREKCRNAKVLHVGCVDSPIQDEKNNLHLELAKFCDVLHGYDVNSEGLKWLAAHHPAVYYSRIEDIREDYDLVLVPETIEHVGNTGLFLKDLDRIKFKEIIITAPNAMMKHPLWNGSYFQNEKFVEMVHPNHKYWFSPYTLKNCVLQLTSWQVERVFLISGTSMVAVEAKKSQT